MQLYYVKWHNKSSINTNNMKVTSHHIYIHMLLPSGHNVHKLVHFDPSLYLIQLPTIPINIQSSCHSMISKPTPYATLPSLLVMSSYGFLNLYVWHRRSFQAYLLFHPKTSQAYLWYTLRLHKSIFDAL